MSPKTGAFFIRETHTTVTVAHGTRNLAWTVSAHAVVLILASQLSHAISSVGLCVLTYHQGTSVILWQSLCPSAQDLLHGTEIHQMSRTATSSLPGTSGHDYRSAPTSLSTECQSQRTTKLSLFRYLPRWPRMFLRWKLRSTGYTASVFSDWPAL